MLTLMVDRRQSRPPPALPPTTGADVREAHEIVRFIFSAIIDSGIPQAEFARRIGVSETTLENWRSPKAWGGTPRGPGLIHVARALHALDLRLDVRRKNEKKGRLSVAVRTGMAETKRDQRRRRETANESNDRLHRLETDARRKGLLPNEDD